MSHLYLLLGRAALAFLFIFSGAGRLAHYAAAQQSFEQLGMPGALLPVVILLEVGGGVAVLAGVFTRVAAGVLGLFSLAVGVLAYGDLTDQNQFIQLSKHAVMAETDDWVAMATEWRAIAHLPGADTARVWEPEPATIYTWGGHA